MKQGFLHANFYETTEKDINDIIDGKYRNFSFQARDLFSIHGAGKLIEINTVLVDSQCRHQNFGSDILKSICTGNDDSIIIAGAGALTSEYPEEPSREEYNKLFEGLDKFYTSNNFQDVTKLFGTYDGSTKRTYLYKNTAGLKAIEKFQNL